MRAKIVTAYVPLPVRHLSKQDYLAYSTRIIAAAGSSNVRLFWDYPLEECWAFKAGLHELPPATPTPLDRYPTPEIHALSNAVQHQRTTWAMMAALESPEIDVWVWLDCAILKQGGWRNKQITEQHIANFFARVQQDDWDGIPFPGIAAKGFIDGRQNDWRFCGSTHIWPTKYLTEIDKVYKGSVAQLCSRDTAIPLDLPAWAMVERDSALPFKWYEAEYDYTQLTNFPEGPNARSHATV
jgi:hypothetical protein